MSDLEVQREIAFSEKADVLKEKARLVEEKNKQMQQNEDLSDCIHASNEVIMDSQAVLMIGCAS